MNTSFLPANILLDQVPGEQFLLPFLQKQVTFKVKDKVIKKGKMLLFRRVHYFIQIALETDKTTRENFEVPIPFRVENYDKECLLYFDYRVSSLNVDNLPPVSSKVSSVYFNNILELSIS